MACRLFGAKPLPEPMLDLVSIGLLKTSFIFIQENAFEHVVCLNGGHFVLGEMSWINGFVFCFTRQKLVMQHQRYDRCAQWSEYLNQATGPLYANSNLTNDLANYLLIPYHKLINEGCKYRWSIWNINSVKFGLKVNSHYNSQRMENEIMQT